MNETTIAQGPCVDHLVVFAADLAGDMGCHADGFTRCPQGGRLRVLQRELLQLHATGRQAVAGVCGAPLDERG